MKWISLIIVLLNSAAAAEPDVPALLLAKTYQDPHRVADYWVSEKLDGVRAYWNGQQLLSRQGHVIHAPAWFVAGFPREKLDGELWIARGAFEDTISTVTKYQPQDEQWQRVSYRVFELPEGDGTFTQRLAKLRSLLSTSAKHIQLIEHYRLSSLSALQLKLDEVVEAGGEGLMLHRADSLYHTGRSDDLLKLKKHFDAEASVVAHLPGKGRHLGRLGALLLEMPNGQRFKLGSGFSDLQRENPPPIGSQVTYKYYGFSQRGIPKFASFMRVRKTLD